MAHPCFSCRRRAWASSVPPGAPGAPWALPFYPALGDPFRQGPGLSGSPRCFCGASCGRCPRCGRPLQDGGHPGPGRPEPPEPPPPAWAPPGPAGDVGSGTPQEPEALPGLPAERPLEAPL